jgi:tagatose 1,6-diphosphate aldolase
VEPLTVGKVRGLQQISDPEGILAICAMDHRGSLQRLLDPQAPHRVDARTLVEVKLDLADALAPVSTAVLLDPLYGAAQAIASGVLPGRTGLLVSLEETGYEEHPHGRLTRLLEGWGAEQVRRMGASGAKLLLYYRPDLPETAARQRDVVRQVAADCRRWDLPFVLEPLVYPVPGEDPQAFAAGLTDLVVRTAGDLAPLGVDVLKAQFPADARRERDPGRWLEACRRLDAASPVPWVLLSGGARFEEFVRQVEIACRAGASGFLGGRAVWEDALRIPDRAERRRWLQTVGAERMRRLHHIAGEHGQPWWRKRGLTPDALSPVSDTWYREYGGGGP